MAVAQLVNAYVQDFYEHMSEVYSIDPHFYKDQHVKRGLRNADGTGVIAGVSKIGSVQGYTIDEGERVPMHGKLYYRGISVEDIVYYTQKNNRFGFEEVAYLLLLGHLPNQTQYNRFSEIMAAARKMPEGFTEDMILKAPSRNIMNQLARSVLALYSFDHNPEDISMENLLRQSIELIARFPLIAANAYQAKRHYFDGGSLYIHNPYPHLSVAENLLRMSRKDKVYTPEEAHLLDLMLILHAEHSSNNSTFVCRALSSSGTDTYSAIAGAVGSLKGPLHGGANAKVMQQFRGIKSSIGETPSDAVLSAHLDSILDGNEGDGSGKIYGLGHAIYTMSDPRAIVIKKYATQLAELKGRKDELELLTRVEEMGVKKVMARKHLTMPMSANVDMYSGFVYDMLDIPEDMFTPLFACARIAGWCAHRMEEVATGHRIMRPAYRSAVKKTAYVPMVERPDGE